MNTIKEKYKRERHGGFDGMQRNSAKIYPFIDDKLSKRELDAFLHHMEECPDCKEEYDIYYTMIMGMRYLEEDNRKSATG